MARMSIDDKFLRDPRVSELAEALAISRWEAMGRLIAVYAVCYDLERDVIAEPQVNRVAELAGFSQAMIDADLAVRSRAGFRIRGAFERIAYLKQKQDSGRIGGQNSAKSRASGAKHPLQAPGEARRNPPDPVPDPAPDLVLAPDPDQKTPKAPRGGKRAPKADVPTPSERASAEVVLAKLGEQNGVKYSGTEAHVGLISAQLRAGISEVELRAVVAYCSDPEREGGLGWRGSDKMHKHLCPETLFGPKTIARYLDPARSKYGHLIAKYNAAHPPRVEPARAEPPLLALIHGGREAG